MDGLEEMLLIARKSNVKVSEVKDKFDHLTNQGIDPDLAKEYILDYYNLKDYKESFDNAETFI